MPPDAANALFIRVSLAHQRLYLLTGEGEVLRDYAVSTASAGAGEVPGSFCTPRGRHLIRAKIGDGAPLNAVFVRRRPTGEIWTPELATAHPGRDWILTRILWLSGCEPGFNRGLDRRIEPPLACDTMRRFIYIHGSPDSATMGVPGSHGCIRMHNRDLLELFALVPCYTPVDITEN